MDQANKQDTNKELATLGGGCFWCLEPIFKDLIGIEQVVVGYSGGTLPNPSYRQVCMGTTGHAEVVQITFDPKSISFKEILEVFFSIHDPTTLNRQGADVGSQYRSVIFYHSEEQRETSEKVIKEREAAKAWSVPMVTEVVPFKAFYKAENDHQDYFMKNPEQSYCRVVITPKVSKFRKQYRSKLRTPSFPSPLCGRAKG
jgi:peptide-methionine (S)-S-oxide reductase